MAFGIGEAANAVTAITNIVDELWTSDEETLDKEALLTRLAQKPHIAQTEINKVEAQHRSLFVAGWRPFIGWVCGTGLAWQFMVRDFLAWCFVLASIEAPPPPMLDTGPLVTLVGSLLGLGALRTVEKLQGRAK